jgi:hypothetical protein
LYRSETRSDPIYISKELYQINLYTHAEEMTFLEKRN